MADITPILMPKWGLSMREGKLAAWHVREGDQIAPGDEIMDVETDKIANVVEAADGGLLRRIVATEGETLPVRALLAVMAPAAVDEAEIDAYVASYETPNAAAGDDEAGPEGGVGPALLQELLDADVAARTAAVAAAWAAIWAETSASAAEGDAPARLRKPVPRPGRGFFQRSAPVSGSRACSSPQWVA